MVFICVLYLFRPNTRPLFPCVLSVPLSEALWSSVPLSSDCSALMTTPTPPLFLCTAHVPYHLAGSSSRVNRCFRTFSKHNSALWCEKTSRSPVCPSARIEQKQFTSRNKIKRSSSRLSLNDSHTHVLIDCLDKQEEGLVMGHDSCSAPSLCCSGHTMCSGPSLGAWASTYPASLYLNYR